MAYLSGQAHHADMRPTRCHPARLCLAMGAVMGACAVAACSGSGSSISKAVVTYTRGTPPGVSLGVSVSGAGDDSEPFVTWAGPGRIFVVTYGSGSCPRLPTSVRSDGPHRVIVKTKAHLFDGDNACTADLGPTTITVNIPDDIVENAAFTVKVDGSTTTLNPH